MYRGHELVAFLADGDPWNHEVRHYRTGDPVLPARYGVGWFSHQEALAAAREALDELLEERARGNSA